jgi:hypothetical protein
LYPGRKLRKGMSFAVLSLSMVTGIGRGKKQRRSSPAPSTETDVQSPAQLTPNLNPQTTICPSGRPNSRHGFAPRLLPDFMLKDHTPRVLGPRSDPQTVGSHCARTQSAPPPEQVRHHLQLASFIPRRNLSATPGQGDHVERENLPRSSPSRLFSIQGWRKAKSVNSNVDQCTRGDARGFRLPAFMQKGPVSRLGRVGDV